VLKDNGIAHPDGLPRPRRRPSKRKGGGDRPMITPAHHWTSRTGRICSDNHDVLIRSPRAFGSWNVIQTGKEEYGGRHPSGSTPRGRVEAVRVEGFPEVDAIAEPHLPKQTRNGPRLREVDLAHDASKTRPTCPRADPRGQRISRTIPSRIAKGVVALASDHTFSVQRMMLPHSSAIRNLSAASRRGPPPRPSDRSAGCEPGSSCGPADADSRRC
jgi:hypothetical protein